MLMVFACFARIRFLYFDRTLVMTALRLYFFSMTIFNPLGTLNQFHILISMGVKKV